MSVFGRSLELLVNYGQCNNPVEYVIYFFSDFCPLGLRHDQALESCASVPQQVRNLCACVYRMKSSKQRS